jgi:hypothetical protein
LVWFGGNNQMESIGEEEERERATPTCFRRKAKTSFFSIHL